MKKKLLYMAIFTMFCLQGFAQAVANQVDEIVQCNNEIFDLNQQIAGILGNQSPNDFNVTFYITQADAVSATNPITNPGAYVAAQSQVIYIRVTSTTDATDYAITSFEVSWDIAPTVPELADVAVCGSFILPAIEWPAIYYTGPNGTGNQIPSGTAVTATQTIYIMALSGSCSAESSFTVTINGPGNIIPPNALVQCDDNGDGVVTFNLQEALDGIETFNPGAVVALYQSSYDAQAGLNPLTNLIFTSINIYGETLYASINTGECEAIYPLQLVIIPCETNNTVSGFVTFDGDNNGCTDADAPAAGILVSLLHNNTYSYTYTDANGFYMFMNVPNGLCYISADETYPYLAVASPANYPITFPANEEDVNFCLTAPEPSTDLAVYFIPVTSTVPGFTGTYALVYQNNGTTIANGNVSLQFDSSVFNYIFSNPSMTLSGNQLSFSYLNLQPLETRIIFIDLGVSASAVTGNTVTFTAIINPIAGDDYVANNTFVQNETIVSSFDPNDITVHEGEFITEEQVDGYLNYTIRFQNTGTANATTVRLETLLNANLDLDTFQPIAGSHNFQANRTGNQLEFLFNNIQLPYQSANEAGSHGFVAFKIKPKATVALGDVMTAQVNIYFDFNTAVPTNIATTTVQNIAGLPLLNANGFVIYPNPASGRVTLQIQNAIAGAVNVTVTDVLGKTVLTWALNGTQGDLDISSLKAGVYFVALNANGKQVTQKLVVK